MVNVPFLSVWWAFAQHGSPQTCSLHIKRTKKYVLTFRFGFPSAFRWNRCKHVISWQQNHHLLWFCFDSFFFCIFLRSFQEYCWNWNGKCQANTKNNDIYCVWKFPSSICLRIGFFVGKHAGTHLCDHSSKVMNHKKQTLVVVYCEMVTVVIVDVMIVDLRCGRRWYTHSSSSCRVPNSGCWSCKSLFSACFVHCTSSLSWTWPYHCCDVSRHRPDLVVSHSSHARTPSSRWDVCSISMFMNKKFTTLYCISSFSMNANFFHQLDFVHENLLLFVFIHCHVILPRKWLCLSRTSMCNDKICSSICCTFHGSSSFLHVAAFPGKPHSQLHSVIIRTTIVSWPRHSARWRVSLGSCPAKHSTSRQPLDG